MTIDLSNYAPLNVFFDVQFGSLKQIFNPPDMPINFSYTLDTGIGKFQMTLFDWTGMDVEPNLFQNQQENKTYQGQFNFGYQTPLRQYGKTDFIMDHYESDVIDNAFNVTIFGSSTLAPTSTCSQLNGTIKDALQAFCDKYGYQLQFDPQPEPNNMRDTGLQNSDTTELAEMKHTKWQNETDMSYVNRIIQYCRDGQGRSGYITTFSDGSDGNPKTLKVFIPKVDQDPVETYNVQAADSNVIRWKPSVSVNPSVLGAHDIHFNTILPISGDNAKLNINQPLMQQQGLLPASPPVQPLIQSTRPGGDPSQIIQVGGAETFEQASVNGATRNRTGGSPSPYSGFNAYISQAGLLNDICRQAELIIIGDPNCPNVGDIIQVNFNYPVTYKNMSASPEQQYTSGKWRIDKIRHEIGVSGLYTTSFTLSRFTDQPKTQGGQ